MAIDINEDIKVWGGFTPSEFWSGCAAMTLIGLLAVTTGERISPLAGSLFFFFTGGVFFAFMIYQRDLPAGILWRRFRQEGRFIFIHIPWVKGVTIYHASARPKSARQKIQIVDTNDRG